MKKLLTLILLSTAVKVSAQTTKPDTLHYKFQEPDIALIDNLMGQFDILAGNSDKVSTAQYTAIHKAVIRVDSLIKIQYMRFHPVKEQPKSDKK